MQGGLCLLLHTKQMEKLSKCIVYVCLRHFWYLIMYLIVKTYEPCIDSILLFVWIIVSLYQLYLMLSVVAHFFALV